MGRTAAMLQILTKRQNLERNLCISRGWVAYSMPLPLPLPVFRLGVELPLSPFTSKNYLN